MTYLDTYQIFISMRELSSLTLFAFLFLFPFFTPLFIVVDTHSLLSISPILSTLSTLSLNISNAFSWYFFSIYWFAVLPSLEFSRFFKYIFLSLIFFVFLYYFLNISHHSQDLSLLQHIWSKLWFFKTLSISIVILCVAI